MELNGYCSSWKVLHSVGELLSLKECQFQQAQQKPPSCVITYILSTFWSLLCTAGIWDSCFFPYLWDQARGWYRAVALFIQENKTHTYKEISLATKNVPSNVMIYLTIRTQNAKGIVPLPQVLISICRYTLQLGVKCKSCPWSWNSIKYNQEKVVVKTEKGQNSVEFSSVTL